MSIEQLSGAALITVAVLIWFAWKIGYDSGYSKGQFDEEMETKMRDPETRRKAEELYRSINEASETKKAEKTEAES